MPASICSAPCAFDQFVEEAADLARVAADFGRAFLGVVQFLDHLHRQEHIVLLELEQRGRVVHQHVGVEHVDALASGHRVSLWRWSAGRADSGGPPRPAERGSGDGAGNGSRSLLAGRPSVRRARPAAWPGTFTPRQACGDAARRDRSGRCCGRCRAPCVPYMFFSWITSKALHSASSASLTSAKLKPCLAQKFWCDFTESRETPSTIGVELAELRQQRVEVDAFGGAARRACPSDRSTAPAIGRRSRRVSRFRRRTAPAAASAWILSPGIAGVGRSGIRTSSGP